LSLPSLEFFELDRLFVEVAFSFFLIMIIFLLGFSVSLVVPLEASGGTVVVVVVVFVSESS